MIIKILKKYKLYIIGAIIGAIGGYMYYSQVGCSTGSCAITSSPVNSTIYGTILGSLLLSFFEKDNNKNRK